MVAPVRRLPAFVALVVGTWFIPPAVAQDVLTVGNGSPGASCITGAAGAVVNVPVYIRDVAGTPLGEDQPAANQIQAFSFRITPTAGAVAVDGGGLLDVTVTRAGVIASVTPTFESKPRTGTTFSYVFQCDVASCGNLAFNQAAAAPGDQIVTLGIRVANTVMPGTTISLTIDVNPAVTTLSNAAGTTAESVGAGLTVASGCIIVPAVATTLTCPPANITVGATGTATINIASAQGSDQTFTLSSGTPAVATVPANATITAGQTSTTFAVTGVGAGVSTITATPPVALGGAAQTCQATVINPTITLTPDPIGVNVGGTAPLTVTINAAQSTPTTITLASSNPAAATVPANATINAGATSATFDVTGVAAGSSTITATLPAGLGGGSDTATANVTAVTITSVTPALTSVRVGQNTTATVTISAVQAVPTTITLSSSSPAVATVPASITIAAGQTTGTFTITSVSVGATTIGASIGAGAATTFVLNATAVTCSLGGAQVVPLSGTATQTVSITQAQAVATTIALSSSNVAAITVPASVTIPAGLTSGSFTVTAGAAAGTATITSTMPAALGGGTCTLATTAGGAEIPALSGWALLALALVFAFAGIYLIKGMT